MKLNLRVMTMLNVLDSNVTYSEFVAKLIKSPETILKTLTPADVNLIHMAIGISGEAGELLDAVKKHTIYNKELDRINIIEELGDLLFYIEGIKNQLGISEKDIITHNVMKLSKRYESLTYSDKAAQERVDKE